MYTEAVGLQECCRDRRRYDRVCSPPPPSYIQSLPHILPTVPDRTGHSVVSYTEVRRRISDTTVGKSDMTKEKSPRGDGEVHDLDRSSSSASSKI